MNSTKTGRLKSMVKIKHGAAIALLASAATISQAAAAPLRLTDLPIEPARPIVADSFCSVAGVDRNMNSVSVHFTQPVTVIVTGSDGYKATRKYNPNYRPGAETADTEGSVLYLRPNMQFTITNTPEDTCSGTMTRKDGRDGVQMEAVVHIMGRTDKAARFIPAGPVDSYVRESSSPDFAFYAALPAEAARIPALKRNFDARTRELQRDVLKIAREQGNERAELKMPPMLTASHYEASKVMGSNPRFLSLLTEAYLYTGGAHEFPGHGVMLWDRVKGKERKIETLFTDGMAAFQEPWCDALDIQREAASEGRWKRASGTKYLGMWECPSLDKLAISPMGMPGQPFDRIRLSAGPYLAGPYSDGNWTVTFPVTADVLSLVKPEFRAAFRVFENGTPK